MRHTLISIIVVVTLFGAAALATAYPAVDRAVPARVIELWTYLDGAVDKAVDYVAAKHRRLTSMFVGG
jgi:hypothetical protein